MEAGRLWVSEVLSAGLFDSSSCPWIPHPPFPPHLPTLSASYHLPAGFTWHNVNAWENDTHVTIDITWALNNSALTPFITEKVPSRSMQGRILRVSMPNPRHPDSPMDGPATAYSLTDPTNGVVTPDFGAVNPTHMWRQPTRFIWAAATDPALSPEAIPFPRIARINT